MAHDSDNLRDRLPARHDHRAKEAEWCAYWDTLAVSSSQPPTGDGRDFIIDSPPPTVSGSLHIGHIFSYSHQDIIARQRRMLGYNVIYPMGWDDNGLPTERRVQNYFNVGVDLALKYEPALDLARRREELGLKKNQRLNVSRQNFVELCWELTEADEKVFENLFRRMGYSIDWSYKYTTISDRSRRIAQRSFLDLYRKKQIYQVEAPTMWDIDFQTAVAQAEVEDRREASAYHDIAFGIADGEPNDSFTIATTRPELLAACVGVAAHPDDPRYQHLIGKNAVTPLFFARVPIFASTEVDMEKGTGILMVCTFGDQMDVHWWQTHGLQLRQIVARNGYLREVQFGTDGWQSLQPRQANANYAMLQGKKINQVRPVVVELLQDVANSAVSGRAALTAPPRPITHFVKYYERGTKPLEYLSQKQWFVRLLDKQARLIESGQRISWHPAFMAKRFQIWTENLNAEWCISRQRYFGVPLPVWYKLDSSGAPMYDAPLVADEASLPVDPTVDVPAGYTETQRGEAGGFVAENDVLDTWFTSSLTPEIVAGWGEERDWSAQMLPMSLRPQSHEIIRTWAFYTIAKSLLHHDTIPWSDVMISGWVLDPDRKKMSKSKGNVLVPTDLLDKFGTDAVRYWAAQAALGVDTSLDENMLRIGSKLVTKLFNAAKFVHLSGLEFAPITEELDRAFIAELKVLVQRATESFGEFKFSGAMTATEKFFWNAFTDNYIELAKQRADRELDGEANRSARATLTAALHCITRLFAPFIPVITEEVWSWQLAEVTGQRSVHLVPWPGADSESAQLSLSDVPQPKYANSFSVACEVLSAVRKIKSEAQVSVKAPIASLRIACDGGTAAVVRSIAGSVADAVNVAPDKFSVDAIAGETGIKVDLELDTDAG